MPTQHSPSKPSTSGNTSGFSNVSTRSHTNNRDDAPPSDNDADIQEQSNHSFDHTFRKKHANLKRRITRFNNRMAPIEAQTLLVTEKDLSVLNKYLDSIEEAMDVLNSMIDDPSDELTPNELDVYEAQVSNHVPEVSDARTRFNRVLSTTLGPPNPVVDAPQPSTKKVQRIDNAFQPDPLEETATPAMFHLWKKQLLVHIRHNGLESAPTDQQHILLYKCLSPELHSTLKRVCDVADDLSLDDLIKEIDKFLLQSNNLISRRADYYRCTQQAGETIQQYITRFREIGDYASLESLSYQESMACRLITGIVDSTLRRELLRLKDHSFQNVKSFALEWEASKTNNDRVDMSTPSATQHPVEKISTYKSNKRDNFKKQVSSSGEHNGKNVGTTNHRNNSYPCCQGWGSTSHVTGFHNCPARGQKCTYCQKLNHFSKICRAAKFQRSRKAPVNQLEDDSYSADVRDHQHQSDQDSAQYHDGNSEVNVLDYAVCQVASENPQPTPRIQADFIFHGNLLQRTTILPDTGATVSVLPLRVAQCWGVVKHIVPTTNSLRSFNGSTVPCTGTIVLKVVIQSKPLDVSFFVCRDANNIILSWSSLRDFGVIHEHFPLLLPSHLQINKVLSQSNSFCKIKNQLVRSFPNVFSNGSFLPPMKGPPMHIYINKNIDFTNIKHTYKPRPIPVPLLPAAKKQIDDMLQNDILAPVSQPTTFLSPMLVVPKKQSAVRLVIDYTELNKFIQRPVHPFPSVQEVKANIPTSAKFFATFDAVKGYWQIPLHKSSQLLTTFLTPWGRYCFKRAPMGLASSGDEYCRRGDMAFQGIQGVIKVVHDLLLFAPTMPQLVDVIHNVLRAANVHNITLSSDKFSIGQSVTFMGLNISQNGITPDKKHLQAISDFPAPRNKTDLRSLLGLVNQFSEFSNDISSHAKSLRPLLSSQTKWKWEPEHQQAFTNLKSLITQSPILQFFDPKRETKLVTDASRLHGLGFALMQKHNNGWALISCGSRFITSTESNYAVCELEALAIVWAILKCRIYLLGLPHFTISTDHKPLVTIFNSNRLVRNDNPRLVRLIQKVTTYNFTVCWIPGKSNHIPDALSRAPIPNYDPETFDIQAIDDSFLVDDLHLRKLSDKANECDQYIIRAIKSNTAQDIKKLPSETHTHLRSFLSIWHRLSVHPRLSIIILDDHRIVVPAGARKKILEDVHASHQGITRTKARLQSLFFWHGMSNDATQLVQSCLLCQKLRGSQPKQPMRNPPKTQLPFQSVSCDLFDYQGAHTITYVDRFSGWPLVAHFPKSPSSTQIISALSTFFRDFGIPRSLRHDGAKPFVSCEFKAFLAKYSIIDELSSAYNPVSNGHAEASVKAVKLLVRKCWQTRQLNLLQFNIALLEWRNTPRMPGGLSPAEILFGRKLRTFIPALNYDVIPQSNILKAVAKNYHAMTNAYRSFNFRKHALPPLNIGDHVRIHNTIAGSWDRSGIVTSIRQHGDSYIVHSQGKDLLRNRRLLKLCNG